MTYKITLVIILILATILGVISLACLDFTVRVYGKSERTMALTFYSMGIRSLLGGYYG